MEELWKVLLVLAAGLGEGKTFLVSFILLHPFRFLLELRSQEEHGVFPPWNEIMDFNILIYQLILFYTVSIFMFLKIYQKY